MAVDLFFDPRRVERLRQSGITQQRTARGGAAPRALPAATPQTALQAIEEAARLRAEIAQLRAENQRLTEEVARLSGRRSDPVALAPDDSAARFALLELDL